MESSGSRSVMELSLCIELFQLSELFLSESSEDPGGECAAVVGGKSELLFLENEDEIGNHGA